jgi:hypothetical protein
MRTVTKLRRATTLMPEQDRLAIATFFAAHDFDVCESLLILHLRIVDI